jgi:hypothetical protein
MTDRTVFVNGPVQNGAFTFADRPGKAASIRLAATLNRLCGIEPALPHLWNTVTLAADMRYRAHTAGSVCAFGRARFDDALITAKYPTGPRPEVLTDAGDPATTLALEMIDTALTAGALQIRLMVVRRCASCGHLAGTADRPCRSCGHERTLPSRDRHLVADRGPAEEVLTGEDFLGGCGPAHLRGIAGNVPGTLLLSRTRDHGIALDQIGLPGLVLDPRAGLHIAVLAAGRARGAERVVMATTTNAAANVAAYGQRFRTHRGTRLLYTLHGSIPYDHLGGLGPRYRAIHISDLDREMFETQFLPLASWKDTGGIPAGELPALLRRFHRARRAAPPEVPPAILDHLRTRILAGDRRWVSEKAPLAAALAATSQAS